MENVMAAKTPEPAGPKKIRRLQIGMNVLIQIVLVLFLVSAIKSDYATLRRRAKQNSWHALSNRLEFATQS
jgi:hypothetical protein